MRWRMTHFRFVTHPFLAIILHKEVFSWQGLSEYCLVKPCQNRTNTNTKKPLQEWLAVITGRQFDRLDQPCLTPNPRQSHQSLSSGLSP
jgi:hypothetical protein